MTHHLPLGPGAEFDRIRAVAATLGERAASLGDDCAIVAPGPHSIVLSTDSSIEDVHFRRDWLTPWEIGWRAAAGALSDLAAEGAAAIGVLAAIALPEGLRSDFLPQLMTGVGDAAEACGGRVLGGDLSRAPLVTVTVTVVGTAERPVRRHGARPGDGVWVTGRFGGPRAALVAFERNEQPAPEARASFCHSTPRIAAGMWLAAHGATAMIDVSDGLAGDARHLAAASGAALIIDLERVPRHASVDAVALSLGEHPAHFAARGGEDYELLCTLPADFRGAEQFEREVGLPLTRIGTVDQGSGVAFLDGGTPVQLQGYDHFA